MPKAKAKSKAGVQNNNEKRENSNWNWGAVGDADGGRGCDRGEDQSADILQWM